MRSTVVGALQRARIVVLALVDSMAWVAAMYLATGLRFETLMFEPQFGISGASGKIPLYGVLVISGVAIAAHLIIAWAFRLHQGRAALGSFEELFLLVSVLIGAAVVATIYNAVVDPTPSSSFHPDHRVVHRDRVLRVAAGPVAHPHQPIWPDPARRCVNSRHHRRGR